MWEEGLGKKVWVGVRLNFPRYKGAWFSAAEGIPRAKRVVILLVFHFIFVSPLKQMKTK